MRIDESRRYNKTSSIDHSSFLRDPNSSTTTNRNDSIVFNHDYGIFDGRATRSIDKGRADNDENEWQHLRRIHKGHKD